MAEHTSTRASSRRTTPQPAPQLERAGTQTPPKRITRITRSQSHDVSDSEDGRKSSKGQKGAKQATPAGTHSATGQSTSKGRKGKSTNHAKNQQGKEFHVTRHTLCLLRQGSSLSTNQRRAHFTKANSQLPSELSDSCIDQRLTSPRTLRRRRRPYCCLS